MRLLCIGSLNREGNTVYSCTKVHSPVTHLLSPLISSSLQSSYHSSLLSTTPLTPVSPCFIAPLTQPHPLPSPTPPLLSLHPIPPHATLSSPDSTSPFTSLLPSPHTTSSLTSSSLSLGWNQWSTSPIHSELASVISSLRSVCGYCKASRLWRRHLPPCVAQHQCSATGGGGHSGRKLHGHPLWNADATA